MRQTSAARSGPEATGPHVGEHPARPVGRQLTDQPAVPTDARLAAPQDHRFGPAGLMAIQRRAGNRAAVSAIAGRVRRPTTRAESLASRAPGETLAPHHPSAPDGQVVVQRHASWEHRLLGDVDPRTLQIITNANQFEGQTYPVRQLLLGASGETIGEERNEATHALVQQLTLLQQWQTSPPAPGATEWNGIRLVTIRLDDGDEVVCTRGEMNGLADFYGSVEQLRRGSKETLRRILQTVRQESWQRLSGVLARLDPGVAAGMRDPGFGGASHFSEGKAADVEMQGITADGRNRRSETYLANVARNACHFAPQSWFVWKDYHERARKLATQAWEARQRAEQENSEPLRQIAANLANEAVMVNGFGDHYLQDSFAAGHLINKTLVMQWFVEWLGTQNWAERLVGTSMGSRWIRDWDNVRTMTTELQPELAGIDLYSKPEDGQANDPQTAENQATRAERIARTGLEDSGGGMNSAYSAYLSFLNSAGIQAAAGDLHDHFCAEGLEVYAGTTRVGYVYGDNAMISGGDGIQFSAETAQMSQKAIDDINSGQEPETVDAIMERLPDHVMLPRDGGLVSLEEWHTGGQLRAFCEETIFPNVSYRLAGRLPLVPMGVSQDVFGGTGRARAGLIRDALLAIGRGASAVKELAGQAWDAAGRGARFIGNTAVRTGKAVASGARRAGRFAWGGVRALGRGIRSAGNYALGRGRDLGAAVSEGADAARQSAQRRLDSGVQGLRGLFGQIRELLPEWSSVPEPTPEVIEEAAETVDAGPERELAGVAAGGEEAHDGPF